MEQVQYIKGQDWISKWATYAPDRMAVREGESGRSFTYGVLNQLGNLVANQLTKKLGLKKGDRIVILAENCLEYIVLFAAAQKTGVILVPLNYRLAGPELDFLLQNARPQLLISEAKFRPKLSEAPQHSVIPHHWPLEDLAAFCQASSLAKPEEAFTITPVEENAPIFILYTSGTTGFPKGAIYTHKMLFWNSINTAMSLIVNSESRTVNCMPPFHTGGWNVLTTPFLHHGGFVCLLKKFDPELVLELLQKEQATIFMGVPTMLKMMADTAAFKKTDFSKLHYMIVGGEPMPVPLIEKWDKRQVPIRQGFGMTEVGPNLTSLHQDDAILKKGSIGRPNFYVEIKIVDNTGAEVPVGKSGELLLKGPVVMPGYWENEKATKQAIKAGWFHSGDLVKQDDDGYLFIVDRIKNMFISGGENVYPAEVERILVLHPAVSEAVVIGVEHKKWGEVGKAFVVKKGTVSEMELLDFVRERLAGFKVPKEIQFLECLPKNDTGKVDRKMIKKNFP